MLRLVAAVAATGLVAIALGCGSGTSSGDGSDEPSAKARVSVTTVTSLTKPSFVAYVNAFCAPPGEKRAVEELLGAMREATDRGSGRASFSTVSQVKALFTPYNREARRYGLDRCLVAGAHLPHPET